MIHYDIVLWFERKFYKYFTMKNANKVSQHSVIHTCVTSSMWLSSKHATCFEFLQSQKRTYNEVIRMRSSTANQITISPCQLTCRSPCELTCILQTTMFACSDMFISRRFPKLTIFNNIRLATLLSNKIRLATLEIWDSHRKNV